MSDYIGRAVRQHQIIDAVFNARRQSIEPTCYTVAKMIGMAASPHLRALMTGLEVVGVLSSKTVYHRSNSSKKVFSVNLRALKLWDLEQWRELNSAWPQMFTDQDFK